MLRSILEKIEGNLPGQERGVNRFVACIAANPASQLIPKTYRIAAEEHSERHRGLSRSFKIEGMRILLDAKDIINVVEHAQPLSINEFRDWLSKRNSVLVYSFENIRALAGPLAIDSSQVGRIVGYLKALESMPHCYISTAIDTELEAAVQAFEENRKYQSIDPYVNRPRFDCVFPPAAQPSRPSYTLSEMTLGIFQKCPEIFARRPRLEEAYAFAMDDDRGRQNLKAPSTLVWQSHLLSRL